MVSKLNKDSWHKAYILTDEHLLKHPFKVDGFFTSIKRTKLTRTWRVVPYAKFPFREIMHYRRALSSKYRITPPPQCCRALISQYRIGIDYVTYGFLSLSLSLTHSLFLQTYVQCPMHREKSLSLSRQPSYWGLLQIEFVATFGKNQDWRRAENSFYEVNGKNSSKLRSWCLWNKLLNKMPIGDGDGGGRMQNVLMVMYYYYSTL